MNVGRVNLCMSSTHPEKFWVVAIDVCFSATDEWNVSAGCQINLGAYYNRGDDFVDCVGSRNTACNICFAGEPVGAFSCQGSR